jgi:hypothetical protein
MIIWNPLIILKIFKCQTRSVLSSIEDATSFKNRGFLKVHLINYRGRTCSLLERVVSSYNFEMPLGRLEVPDLNALEIRQVSLIQVSNF